MNSEHRPDPEDLLKALEHQESFAHRGHLRVFLGMSAGVGKTYAMLKAAHQKLKEGVDVVLAVVETHGRPETESLVEGLAQIPRKKIEYRGTVFEELDLEEVLRRQPELVIIDELPHSNLPGSRHAKRYQDVLEILTAGIDVYTALNVQHLESRKESVESIVGTTIRETVPDSILEQANQIELVDISPMELLKRLKEGKVYLGDKAQRAEQNFFKEDTLTALREIALRITAERVDQDLQRFASLRGDGKTFQANERLLVAVSHSPYSEKLIRATRRLAYNLDSPWIALHVDTGINLNDTDQAQLVKNLSLARELKAEVITTTEVDVPSAVRRICRNKNVTQVVVGRPTRRWFRSFFERGHLLERLVSECLDLDVHVLRHEGESLPRPKLWDEVSYYRSQNLGTRYWYAFCLIAGVGLLGGFLESLIGYRSVGFLFLLASMIVGIFGSIGAVVFAATLSVLAWDAFFIPPTLTFVITQSEDLLMCISFFVVALITGFLAHRIRLHERMMRVKEEHTSVLYEVLKDISEATEKSDFIVKVTERVGRLLQASCGVVLKNEAGHLDFYQSKAYGIFLKEKDQAVAQWTFDHQKTAGWSTDTLAQSRALFLPLLGAGEIVGVFVFQPNKKFRKLDLEQENLLLSIVGQLGVSIEKHFLTKRLAKAQRIKDSEELHQTLLNSISHEMRTPLTAILGAASALETEVSIVQEHPVVKEIAGGLLEAGERLNRVIENLLDMSRLNSGRLSLNLEWHDFQDLVSVVLQKNSKALRHHKVVVQLLDGVSLVKMDYRLMEHALSNLLLNAAAYTPPGTNILLEQKPAEKLFLLEIADQGPGVAPEFLPHLFEKFYRVPGSPTGGTGLGLSIVKSIIELHDGRIEAVPNLPQGLKFQIELPMMRKTGEIHE